MADAQKLREVVERIVSQTLHAHVSSLTSELVNGACRGIEPLLAQAAPAGEPATAPQEQVPAGGMPTDLLNAAFASVMDSQSQADILSSLIDGTAKFSQRSALFVIKGGSAVGWRARGFENNEAIKNVHFDPTTGLAARAYNHRQLAQSAAAEFDSGFISTFGEPLAGTNVIVVPLVVRDKVAALVYADGGAIGKLDPSAVECLTRGASLWLEIVAARKSGAPAPTVEAPPPAAEASVSEAERTGTEKIRALSDTAAPPTSPSAPEYSPVTAAPEPSAAPVGAAAAAAASAPAAGTPAEDEEVHKKAKRFAKLLVDEIKLYNQKKVAEGRENRDLYKRLKDDIDKSRASYEKRFGQTAAASANYFSQELIRILCDGDASLLGSGFSG